MSEQSEHKSVYRFFSWAKSTPFEHSLYCYYEFISELVHMKWFEVCHEYPVGAQLYSLYATNVIMALVSSN